jgi:CO dehydrogenase nickel-insertion accessory protein CooC1
MKLSVCGKGGSGKSTVVTLLARQAAARGRAVLVIDAHESNTGLYRMLGFDHPPISTGWCKFSARNFVHVNSQDTFTRAVAFAGRSRLGPQ